MEHPPTLAPLAAPRGALSGLGRPGATDDPPTLAPLAAPQGALSGLGRPGATEMVDCAARSAREAWRWK